MIETKKVIVVMPAYNAEATLEQTIADIPFKCVDELLLVDDASKDNTVALAKRIAERHPALMLSTLSGEQGRIPFNVISLEQNRGYGGNQKNCYAAALARGADIVVMLHPDYQYDPKLITYFVGFIRDGYFDVMLGSRIRSRQEALNGGMPLYKYYANRLLTLIENIAEICLSGTQACAHILKRFSRTLILNRFQMTLFSTLKCSLLSLIGDTQSGTYLCRCVILQKHRQLILKEVLGMECLLFLKQESL